MTGIIAIVQARMGSTRLPGKVLLDLAGKPMLVRDIERIRRSKKIDDIVIATTTKTADEKIISLCRDNEWNFFRGSENDVLDRYYQAAREYHAKTIVRITSDCPLIEPKIIDKIIEKFLTSEPDIDYVSNTFPLRTYPRGLDTEVMSFSALERCWKEELNPAYREHVTPYIYRNPDKFRISEVNNEQDLSSMRWTVDTPEDFEFVNQVYHRFGESMFSWTDVLDLLQKHPELLEINKEILQKTI
ncbi:MAG: glycosyltransferase family protein [Methanoregula sp.]|uniref:glycosyltransferase family protein n=1 Tax=Methanoregula sp. TaxID=2052170 RepID=UPI0025DEB4F5|nr:glycosyltransferase family protein [Methanoregula sp.]MCK9631770.1 glycosyltransferase family protein [Methanoregula sp.]